jgi:hypothetical protein
MKKQLLSLFASGVLGIAAFAQVPNGGMETWVSQFGEDQQPQSWISYNVFTVSLIDPGGQNPTSVSQATGVDAYQGTYAAKITTVDLVVNPDAATIPNRAGILLTGTVSIASPYIRPGYISTNRPVDMTYYAKYTPVGNDTASCLVVLTKWNSSTNSRDTVAWGYDMMPLAVSSYALRTVTMTYLSMSLIPDSAVIMFSSSSSFTPSAGSALWVDALSFNGYVGMNEHAADAGVNVYPNPSSTITCFEVTDNSAAYVAVYDMAGREITRTDISNKKAILQTNMMESGVYSYAVLNSNGETLSRGRFCVAH